LLVAPATANTIGKLANGIADDFLTSLYLATRAPVLLAPAMNTNMLEHPAVQRNMQTLASRGVRFVDPGDGFLACGWIGKGRLAEPDAICEAAEGMLRPAGTLLGRRIVVSAGPTYKDIDPVRYLGNRSSGRMGYAVAADASRRGTRRRPPPRNPCARWTCSRGNAPDRCLRRWARRIPRCAGRGACPPDAASLRPPRRWRRARRGGPCQSSRTRGSRPRDRRTARRATRASACSAAPRGARACWCS